VDTLETWWKIMELK